MKNLFFISLLLLVFSSCEEDKPAVNQDSLRADSALRAQAELKRKQLADTTIHAKDTMHMVALPPVMEGDIVFQNESDEQSTALGQATHSKYNNVGMIFVRPRDKMYMVLCIDDSVHTMPLTEWVDHGEGQHVALLRLRNVNQEVDDRRSKQMRQVAKSTRGKKEDHYFSWKDDEFYSSELIWKLYNHGYHIDLCTPGPLSRFDLSGPLVKLQMKNKYGANIPKDELTVSPDDLYKSPKLELIYER